MNAYQKYLNELLNRNKLRYEKGQPVNWANPYNVQYLQDRRDQLLAEAPAAFLFKDTKPYYSAISEGCRRCGEGTWSCLFITGRCNASCFYCPAAQIHDEVPESQGLHFPEPESYAEYVKYFGFNAVAFSGGEPLLYPERLMAYLKEIRKHCDPGIYAWMYTNGRLATREIFQSLSEAGLDEVRFDIGATAYSLENIKMAVGMIPTVTVEIPAIPEHAGKLKALLPEMEKIGVRFLNLHQLRLTPHNAAQLLKRDYTFVPAEKPVVAESEITALEIMQHAREKGLSLGINYCSFFFKNRFQQAGFRKIIGAKHAEAEAAITEQGYLRMKQVSGISYGGIRIAGSTANQSQGEKLHLGQRTYAIERFLAYAFEPEASDNTDDISMLLQEEPLFPPENPLLFNLWRHEYIERGLREY